MIFYRNLLVISLSFHFTPLRVRFEVLPVERFTLPGYPSTDVSDSVKTLVHSTSHPLLPQTVFPRIDSRQQKAEQDDFLDALTPHNETTNLRRTRVTSR